MLRLWAYVRPYNSSDERAAALAPWLVWYNRQRPHGSLQDRTPVDTLKDLQVAMPDASLYFITGADALADIFTWRDADELFELAQFVGCTRPGFAGRCNG